MSLIDDLEKAKGLLKPDTHGQLECNEINGFSYVGYFINYWVFI